MSAETHSEAELAAWLADQIIPFDAGLLEPWQVARLDEVNPGWHNAEARAAVGLLPAPPPEWFQGFTAGREVGRSEGFDAGWRAATRGTTGTTDEGPLGLRD